MARVAQFGIALGTLGAILTLMGLFPGITGLRPTASIGILQIVTILAGLALLISGALVYVKFMFYANQDENLAQQVGIRLALTGLVFAAICGIADVLGFGSNPGAGEYILGPLQAFGLIGSFLVASLGVLIYALAGSLNNGR
ncbi:MAG: hypothetical protein HXY40_15620 [Chloroflexi bacterium]|nr:hypothetical protein [Chloroflexota bacterium]